MALNIALHGLAAALAYVRSGYSGPSLGHIVLLRAELAAGALARTSGEDDPTAIAPRLDALSMRLLTLVADDAAGEIEMLATEILADLSVVAQRLGRAKDPDIAGVLISE